MWTFRLRRHDADRCCSRFVPPTYYTYAGDGRAATVTKDYQRASAVRFDYTYDPDFPEKVLSILPKNPTTGALDPNWQGWKYDYYGPATSTSGGAGAALALLFNEVVDHIVINDLDKAIYSFWRSAIFESERFIEKLDRTPATVKEWRKQKAIYENRKAKRFDRGFATFFLNRTNRSGILNGGPIGGLDQTGNWKIDARYNKKSLAKRLRDVAEYKSRITVSNEDGVDLVGRYLRQKNVSCTSIHRITKRPRIST